MQTLPTPIQIKDIYKMLPHRYPFLMVDRVTEYTPDEFLKGYKNVSVNEPFFQGHFPGLPVMPGVLMIEAIAQAGGMLVMLSQDDHEVKDQIFLFTGIDKVRFRRPVVPGDRLDLEVSDVRRKMSMIKMTGKATVNGELAAQGVLSAALVDREGIY